jgi:hypothetical protein
MIKKHFVGICRGFNLFAINVYDKKCSGNHEKNKLMIESIKILFCYFKVQKSLSFSAHKTNCPKSSQIINRRVEQKFHQRK